MPATAHPLVATLQTEVDSSTVLVVLFGDDMDEGILYNGSLFHMDDAFPVGHGSLHFVFRNPQFDFDIELSVTQH